MITSCSCKKTVIPSKVTQEKCCDLLCTIGETFSNGIDMRIPQGPPLTIFDTIPNRGKKGVISLFTIFEPITLTFIPQVGDAIPIPLNSSENISIPFDNIKQITVANLEEGGNSLEYAICTLLGTKTNCCNVLCFHSDPSINFFIPTGTTRTIFLTLNNIGETGMVTIKPQNFKIKLTFIPQIGESTFFILDEFHSISIPFEKIKQVTVENLSNSNAEIRYEICTLIDPN
ncbi:hypothetical protein [Cytobacillus sp. IB215316]|uniref:hypothetical protein n=1 Tax=Cytobacillus sp. IB215316 TaxID=3097354 RepID=UPI002A125692|nr:hypothetical protein [Cytobacillus sp. IB215316]MDX8363221.1 hypothetical protein [Cytobacillus sp. IB215316]